MFQKVNLAFEKLNGFLDRFILPWPVRFLTYRLVILSTILLLVPLIVFANQTAFVLAANSYLNVMSVAVSSIVLLYATISETRQQQIAEMQEKRAQEDHLHVTEMHKLVMQELINQNEEMAELKCLITTLLGQDVKPGPARALPDLQSLHPRGKRRFDRDDIRRCWEESQRQNQLVNEVREGTAAPKKK